MRIEIEQREYKNISNSLTVWVWDDNNKLISSKNFWVKNNKLEEFNNEENIIILS